MTDDARPSSDSAPVPWATTQTTPYAVPAPPAPGSPPAGPGRPDVRVTDDGALPPADTPGSAPAVNPPTWSGRKTAIAAALAIGISSMGAIAAAAALPTGVSPEGRGQFQPGGLGGPGGQQGQLGGTQQGPQQGTPQLPGGTSPLPQQGGPVPGIPGQGMDPNAAVPGRADRAETPVSAGSRER